MIYSAVAFVVLFVIVGMLLYFIIKQAKSAKQLKQKLAQLESLLFARIDPLKVEIDSHQTSILQLPKIIEQQSQLHEDIQNVINLCGNYQQALDKVQNDLQLLQSHSTEDKLYVRAKKLIALGADIEEVISETGISRSEADLLISIVSN